VRRRAVDRCAKGVRRRRRRAAERPASLHPLNAVASPADRVSSGGARPAQYDDRGKKETG